MMNLVGCYGMFLVVNPPLLPLPLPLSVQIINFRESVTLDFLDAELEDSNKEEVTQKRLRDILTFNPKSCPCKWAVLESVVRLHPSRSAGR